MGKRSFLSAHQRYISNRRSQQEGASFIQAYHNIDQKYKIHIEDHIGTLKDMTNDFGLRTELHEHITQVTLKLNVEANEEPRLIH